MSADEERKMSFLKMLTHFFRNADSRNASLALIPALMDVWNMHAGYEYGINFAHQKKKVFEQNKLCLVFSFRILDIIATEKNSFLIFATRRTIEWEKKAKIKTN